jgi:hypothetical protein
MAISRRYYACASGAVDAMLNDIVGWVDATVGQVIYELRYLSIVEWSGQVWTVVLLAFFVGLGIVFGLIAAKRGASIDERQSDRKRR